MSGDQGGMPPHFPLMRFLVRGFHRGKIGFKGGVGVHRNDPVARQIYHEVGTLQAVGTGLLRFGGRIEVAVVLHAGEFHYALELEFAPAAASGRLAQGLDQLGGFLLETELGAGHLAHVFAESCFCFTPGTLEIFDAALHLVQGGGDRLDEGFHRHTPLLQLTGGFLLPGIESVVSILDELALGVAKGLERHGLEVLRHPGFGVLEKLLFFNQTALLCLGQELEFRLTLESHRLAVTELAYFRLKVGTTGFQVGHGFPGSPVAFLVARAYGVRFATAQEPGEGRTNRSARGSDEMREPRIEVHSEVTLADWVEAGFLREQLPALAYSRNSRRHAKQTY